MKALVWVLCLAALSLSAFLGIQNSGHHALVVELDPPGPETTAIGKACPPRTLPDDGACVPVPRPTESVEMVPRVPSRPETLQAYVLPAVGSVQLGSWADVDSGLPFPTSGPALLIAAAPGTPVHAVTLSGALPVLHHRGERWLLLRTDASAERANAPAKTEQFLAVLGPLESAAELEVGATLTPGTVLGKALPGGIGFAVRKLRPNQAVQAESRSLADDQSILVDPRNALPLVEVAP